MSVTQFFPGGSRWRKQLWAAAAAEMQRQEAAGISRFRYRKEEAERKLQKTEENLLRIHDKIEELELQVVPLKKQAETLSGPAG